MAVWFAIPTASPHKARINLPKWRAMGYKVAIYLGDGAVEPLPFKADMVLRGPYPGWPRSTNLLMRTIFESYPLADVVIGGGDDMEPDPKAYAAELEKAFLDRFPDTMGVMQPTGDRWGCKGGDVALADRICGSPWVGRQFCARWNSGIGPLWPAYWHYYADEELKMVTEAAGVLWQNREVTQRHLHWSRVGEKDDAVNRVTRPHLAHDKQTFALRLKAGFPGHQPKGEDPCPGI